MALIDLLRLDGAGFAWLVDVSFDNFATVSHRWSTVSVLAGSDQYEARIAESGLGKLSRGFGQDNTSRAGTVTLLLDNTDFGADWLVDRTTVATQVLRARFRLKLFLYQPGNLSNNATKTMGTFSCMDWPSRDDRSVAVQLADDTMGRFDVPLISPTINDWRSHGGSTVDNCPLHVDYAPRRWVDSDWDTPLPLAFGAGRLNCFPADADHGNDAAVGDMDGMRAIVVCATRSSATVTADDVNTLWAIYREDTTLKGAPWDGAGGTIKIPKQFTIPQGFPTQSRWSPGTYTIWEPQKTQTISKDGVDWKILWVKFDITNYGTWWQFTNPVQAQSGNSPNPVAWVYPVPPGANAQSLPEAYKALAYFQVTGYPFSAITVDDQAAQRAVDVIEDLISYYSNGSGSDLDTDRLDAARATQVGWVSGIIQPQRPVSTRFKYSKQAPPADALTSGQLRQAISDICQSADLDFAMTWDGKLAVYNIALSYEQLTDTRVSLDETRCWVGQERTPSKGERWAPYNRVYVVFPDGTPHGPFDNPDPEADLGVVLERTIQQKWAPANTLANVAGDGGFWWSYRRLETKVRPIVQFLTDKEGLQLDVGDLFDFTWTRGGSAGPYNTPTVFRVEEMSVDPDNLAVNISAVWVNDLATEYPYLLDDETFLAVVASGGGRTATVVDSDATVTFSSGNLVSDGVVAGDVLVLTDATQADNVFSRFRQLRIASVTDATHLEVDDADLDFDAGAGVAVASWKIVRGYETYPDSSSDPTNYPNDGDMYGKICDDDDEYSDDSSANKVG